MRYSPGPMLTLVALFVAVGGAQAYVGPGAGLSLLGALWGLIVAVGAALLFLVLWPLRRARRRARARQVAEAAAVGPQPDPAAETPAPAPAPAMDAEPARSRRAAR